jgi:hypothetical protein
MLRTGTVAPGAIGGGKEGERNASSGATWRGPQPSGEDTGCEAALAAKSRSSQAERKNSAQISADVAGSGLRRAQRDGP